MMKQSIFFKMTVLFVVSVLCGGCGQNSRYHYKTVNSIYVDSPVDWGQSVGDDTIRISTVCHNTSREDVYIHYIETPCGCIIAIPESDVIKKGDSVRINIKYKPEAVGYIEKNLFVHLKNRDERPHFLLKGKVKREQNYERP